MHATVSMIENRLVAELSNGRQIDRGDFRAMAEALFRAGVSAHAVQYEWRAGQRMITAGQQVALRAEIAHLTHQSASLSMAA